MAAMMIDDGKRVTAGGARLQWHTLPIADIDLIARNSLGEENGVASSLRGRWDAVEVWRLLDRVDDVGTDLLVALQL
jgi:hypothetical protein